MKQTMLLTALATAIIGTSAIAGAVRAKEMAVNTHENTQITVPAEDAAAAALKEISAEELQVLIDTNPELVIIDARRPHEFAQGHIPGAVAVTPGEASPERLTALAPSKETPMVFYCGSVECPASGKAAYKAAEQGYAHLYKYTAGIADWKAKGLPVVSE
jgi:rhodanese-related sulfurtransferase